MTVEDMADHIERLCFKHCIVKLEKDGASGRAWKRSKTIKITPVRSQKSYATALHEIGHIVGRGRSGTRLEKEAAAWTYAIENAVCAFTPSTYKMILRCLDSYLRPSKSRKSPAYDHPFWMTYARIEQASDGK